MDASIFLGNVTDVTIDQSSCVGQLACNEKVRVQPLEVFKGNPSREIIDTNIPLLKMAKGHEYLIWTRAPRDNGDVDGHGTEIANVAPETLAWLRAYPTAPQTVRIYGKFRNVPSTLDATHILVTLTGTGANNSTLTTTPDGKFLYSFNDVPPGIYTVAASVPGGLIASTAQGSAYDSYADHNQTYPAALRPTPTGAIPKINESIISIAPKGCANIDFTILYDSHIKGRVASSYRRGCPCDAQRGYNRLG